MFAAVRNATAVPPVPTMTPASNTLTPCAPVTSMPTEPETVPLLAMPPVKLPPMISMAVPAATILLALSIRMPWLVALIVPASTIAPLMVLCKIDPGVIRRDLSCVGQVADESGHRRDDNTVAMRRYSAAIVDIANKSRGASHDYRVACSRDGALAGNLDATENDAGAPKLLMPSLVARILPLSTRAP